VDARAKIASLLLSCWREHPPTHSQVNATRPCRARMLRDGRSGVLLRSRFTLLLSASLLGLSLLTICDADILVIDAGTPGAVADSIAGSGPSFDNPQRTVCANQTAFAGAAFSGAANEETQFLNVAVPRTDLPSGALVTGVRAVVGGFAIGSTDVEVFQVDVGAGATFWSYVYGGSPSPQVLSDGIFKEFYLPEVFVFMSAAQNLNDKLIYDPLEFRVNFRQVPATPGTGLVVRCFRLEINYTVATAGTTAATAPTSGATTAGGVGTSGSVVVEGSTTGGLSTTGTPASDATTLVPVAPTGSTTPSRPSTGSVVETRSSSAPESGTGALIGAIAGSLVVLLVVVGIFVMVVRRRAALDSTGKSSSMRDLSLGGAPAGSTGQYHNTSHVTGGESSVPLGAYHNLPASSEAVDGEMDSVAKDSPSAGQYHNLPGNS
jgi:hypothetical protein